MSIESRSRQYGKVFDHWQIREFLGSGSGGKSAVFRLVHSNSSSVQSALKVISLIEKRGDFESLSESRKAEYERVRQTCKDRAEQEVLLMNGLQGRTNVVDYLDHIFIDWKDGNSFGCDMLIRMELLKDLRSEIEDDRVFSENDILKIGREICTALVLCHSKNILHRDIKPENIFFNEDGNYKLGDFGVSRILSTAPTSKASTGVCTPEYAAPEQMSGKYDTRVDIYSLGLVLYELSNGNLLPFATTSSYITEIEVQERLLGKPLPVPCNASKSFAAVILKACAFDPEDRYQTAEDFLADLNCLAGVAPGPVINTVSVGVGTQKATPAKDRYTTILATPPDHGNETQNPGSEPEPPKDPDNTPGQKPLPKYVFVFVAIFVIILLTLLFPSHTHIWEDATCETPKTCSECGETAGNPLEHNWQEATCTSAKTCLKCGTTEGNPLEHSWQPATCVLPNICVNCGAEEGDAQGHTWIPATYTSAKICASCGETEGSPLSLQCVAAGVEHSVYLRPDGTVYACGQNSDGQCNVFYWENVSSVYAGDHTTFGLTESGTVYSAGSNSNGQCNTSNWTNIIALAAGDRHTVGLNEQGLLVGTGLNDAGQLNLQSLYGMSEIVDIAAGYGHTVALHADGTVSAVGSNKYGQCDVFGWTDIAAIAAGTHHTVGLKTDGSIVATGDNRKGQCNVETWTGITRIAAGDFFTVGIKSDGSVSVVGDNHYDSFDSSDWPDLDVSAWKDIVTVACGNGHMIAVSGNGKLIATGNNLQGQCNIATVP